MTKGQRITYLRNRKNMSQHDLSRALNVSPSTIGMWERDQRAIKDDDLINIATFFDVTTDYLLTGKTDLGNTPVAAHLNADIDSLSEQDQKEIREYIEFKKAQYAKRHQKD